MSDDPIRVLLVEDNPGDARLICEMLAEARDTQIEVDCVDRLSPGLERLAAGGIDVLLLDLSLPDGQGLDVCVRAHTQARWVPIVVLTGLDDETMAVKALQVGAQDYLVKGQVDSRLLLRSIHYAIERKRAEETLRESEQKYRSLFENMLNGFAYCQILVDANNQPIDFVYLEVNDAFERLTGLKREDVIGRKITEAIPETMESHPELVSIYGKVALTGEATSFDLYFEPLEIWLTIFAYSPQRGYFVAIFENTTERKRAEEALKDSEAELSAIFNNSPIVMVLMDSEYRVMRANRAAISFSSCPGKEMIGLRGGEAFCCTHYLDDPRGCGFSPSCKTCKMRSTVMETFKTGKNRYRVEAELVVMAEGKQQALNLLVSSVLLNDSKDPMVLACFEDVTERKQAEEAVKREKERAEKYLDIAGVMLATIDVDEKITLINKKGCDILGYKEQELIGRNWFDTLVPERVREERRSIFRSLISNDIEQTTRENLLLTKDGEERIITFYNTAIRDQKGQVAGRLLSGEDITEHKRLEQQLQQSQLLASLGKMTAGIAHEVNNPLGSILLYSEMLMASNAPSQIRKDLRVIHDEAKRAARIMTDLLTYGHRVKSQMRLLNLHSLLKKVLDMRRYEEKVRNINISTNLLDGPLYVKGDSSQLTQVFINLMLNAEEALKESNGGNIVITTQIDGKWARVSIADDGTGILQENLSQVFYPFFSTKPAGEGTGLGLSTCYGIVTGHAGVIRAENNEIGGATFTVELPLAETRRQASLPQERKGASLITT